MVVPGDSTRMAEVVGSRKNLIYTGSTSGSCIQECYKSDLSSVPKLTTTDKHTMLDAARVKDDSRSKESSRGSKLVKVLNSFQLFHSVIIITCRNGSNVSSTLPGLDVPGMEPMDASCWLANRVL